MAHEVSSHCEPAFSPEDMVNASELREFVFCERAWFLARQGYRVSPAAQVRREIGLAFHEARAADAQKARQPQTAWSIILLVLTAIALLLISVLLESR